jgi:hypothetical protein
MASFFQCIPRAVFNTASLTGSYQALNGSGFSHEIKMLKIYNAGNVGIDISYDGVNDHDYYPAGSTFILDLQTNHATESNSSCGELRGRQGQIIYGKGSAGAGNLYIIGYF